MGSLWDIYPTFRSDIFWSEIVRKKPFVWHPLKHGGLGISRILCIFGLSWPWKQRKIIWQQPTKTPKITKKTHTMKPWASWCALMDEQLNEKPLTGVQRVNRQVPGSCLRYGSPFPAKSGTALSSKHWRFRDPPLGLRRKVNNLNWVWVITKRFPLEKELLMHLYILAAAVVFWWHGRGFWCILSRWFICWNWNCGTPTRTAKECLDLSSNFPQLSPTTHIPDWNIDSFYILLHQYARQE